MIHASGGTITLKRRFGPDWHFIYVEGVDGSHHFVCKQKKHTYRLFLDSSPYKQIWIGRRVETEDGVAWVTDEDRIGAHSLVFSNGTFEFKR